MRGLSLLFPPLAILVSVAAYGAPGFFAAGRGLIVPLLTVIMFAMGLTLQAEDLRRVLRRPQMIGLGVALQYGVMPLAAFVIGTALSLPPELLAGLVLLGSCPGGTASNVMSYLAKADVALSVSMTMASTLLAVVATPTLVWLYVGKTVPVDVAGMLESLVQIVVVPVVAGALINHWFTRFVEPVKVILPAVAAAAILAVIAIVVALNHDSLAAAGPAVFVAVLLHNTTGLACGYLIPRAFGIDRVTCRTLAIETGMQNSGLGVALAVQYFSALAALPNALASVWQNISGAALAGFWSTRVDKAQRKAA
ncbi:MAG: bile acid:sodium symporter family protein [Bauldia sp.]|uniref:bile acid:sodium symporter family protein n=1 Tax=Bauldia sp. TaxID=2575872 RepID=UPI001E06E017|nr:bile acid:sodium symporter family protein [Bauldia sp.]MCB1494305.1 bile acid:sodium symporter family protein [Bauldia sp.]